MSKSFIYIGSHNHVPAGSPEDVFEYQYKNVYKPFLVSLYRFPELPAVLHFSGVVLEWLEKKHPEFLCTLEEMLNRKQIELMGGGFYEPFFPIIPHTDRLGQIELLTTFIRKRFGKRPKGCWLPGFVWDPNFPVTLQNSGIDYVFLGQQQFQVASGRIMEGYAPCLTEDQGKLVTVFPFTDMSALPDCMDDPEVYIKGLLKACLSKPGRHLTLFPDLQGCTNENADVRELKLGVLFSNLLKHSNSFEFTTPSKILRTSYVEEKLYFPSSASSHVLSWTTKNAIKVARKPSASRKRLLENRSELVLPRNFLVRYAEANNIYAKMMYTHILINQLRGDKARKKAAREELLKAQSADAFWHLGSDGVHLGYLRKHAYTALIDAEKMTREKGSFTPSLVPLDYDMDGRLEYLFQGKDINCYVDSLGGKVFELDYLPKSWNCMDTFGRYREPYTNEEAVYDAGPRASFADKLLHSSTTFKDYEKAELLSARLCYDELYEQVALDRTTQYLVLRNKSKEHVPFGSIEIEKRYDLEKSTLKVLYTLQNTGTQTERFIFSPSIDIAMSSDSDTIQKMFISNSKNEETSLGLVATELKDIRKIVLHDISQDLGITLEADTAFRLWIQPIYSQTRVARSIVPLYQSTSISPAINVVLEPEEVWSIRFTLSLTKM